MQVLYHRMFGTRFENFLHRVSGFLKLQHMKWAVIGPGSIAHDFINDFDEVDSHQELVSVVSHRRESAQEFADKFGVSEVYTDVSEFLANTTAEIVYVSTPHTKHFSEVKACLEAGLHVLCEKPMGINGDQYRQLYQTAKQHQCYLLEGMWLRFLPHIQMMLEQISNGTIGRVIAVKASMGFQAPRDPDSRYFDPELGGGSLLDLGVYTVFLAVLLLGKPDEIRCIGTLTDRGIDESVSILLNYKDKRHAVLESSLQYNTDLPAVVIGERGQISLLNPWFEKSPGIEIRTGEDEPDRRDVSWKGLGLHFEIAEVTGDIAAGRTTNEWYTPQFSLEVIDVMDEVRRQLGVRYPGE